ncbi:hypothetical protein DB354_10480 [Opitutus sp. ER46]|nr:hypothetical protein DB354_10480 [Opitutus sp. ER46]
MGGEFPYAEKEAFAATISRFLEIKGEWEATLIQRASFDGTTLKLVIPAYAEVGQRFREMLFAKIRGKVSPENYSRIVKEASADITALFDSFGKVPQTFEVQPTSPQAGTGKKQYMSNRVVWDVDAEGHSAGWGGWEVFTAPDGRTVVGPYCGVAREIAKAYGIAAQ